MDGVSDLFAGIVNQDRAVGALRAAARRPLHAYLLVGPPGTGKRRAARSFAACLLCPVGGDGGCEACRRVLAGSHPDVVVVERDGPAITMDAAREITRLAARSPVEAERKVIILPDFHLVKDAGPALLKTIEEPPASAVFVVLADSVPPELVTIASRCVRIDFRPLSVAEVAAALLADATGAAGGEPVAGGGGVGRATVPGGTGATLDPVRATAIAEAAGGRLDRARLLAGDPELERRLAAWRSVPARLDGHGAGAAQLAGELVSLLDSGLAPARARQEEELRALEERNFRAAQVNGKVSGGKAALRAGARELEERHRRELRRQRTDELKAGLAVLAAAYRDRAAAGGPGTAPALRALALIQQLAVDLAYNPGELLALQALLVRLGRLEA